MLYWLARPANRSPAASLEIAPAGADCFDMEGERGPLVVVEKQLIFELALEVPLLLVKRFAVATANQYLGLIAGTDEIVSRVSVSLSPSPSSWFIVSLHRQAPEQQRRLQ